MKIIRQGDVAIRPTKQQPTARAKVITDQGRTILAYGEVTGHAHEVITELGDPATGGDDTVPAQQLFEEPDGTRLLVVKGPATFVRHEEHAKLHIPEGTYEVIRQREYSPEAIRNVAD